MMVLDPLPHFHETTRIQASNTLTVDFLQGLPTKPMVYVKSHLAPAIVSDHRQARWKGGTL
jgi:hypothetical protein